MNIAFRTDASLQIGTGHVMRCLTLADSLRAHGASSVFVCREHEGHLLELIAQRGHRAVSLPLAVSPVSVNDHLAHAHWLGADWEYDAKETLRALGDAHCDWLVVDHYALDARWERAVRSKCTRLMVIDDLADRAHDCDVLLDQNLGRSADDYAQLLPSHAARLIGPRYALLRPEFTQLREMSLARRVKPHLRHVLVTMGGVDKDNATHIILNALNDCVLPVDTQITIVMGPHAPWLEQVRAQASQMRYATRLLIGVKNMAQLMAECDLAIGAAGSTCWELCCLGVPSVLVVMAENQRLIAESLARHVSAMVFDMSNVKSALKQFLEHTSLNEMLKSLSDVARMVTDGRGVDKNLKMIIC